MNYIKLANAFNTLEMAFHELKEAVMETSSTGTLDQGRGMADASPSGSSAPTFSDGKPVEEPPIWDGAIPIGMDVFKDPPYTPPAPTEQDRVLAECPVHFQAWTVKEGGISKNGKPYSAFWKCSGKNDDDTYCNRKPDKGWVRTHDPEKALAAA